MIDDVKIFLCVFRDATAKRAVPKFLVDWTWRSTTQPVGEGTLWIGNAQLAQRRTRHARLPAQVCGHFHFLSFFVSFHSSNDPQFRMANRNSAKINDGSLSDTQTYAEVKPEFSTYAMWLKHNSPNANRMSEGDSLESVSIVSSPGMNRNSKLMQSRETTPTAQPGPNSRLNRSNSIRYALRTFMFF
jgi:hypothetical protein